MLYQGANGVELFILFC